MSTEIAVYDPSVITFDASHIFAPINVDLIQQHLDLRNTKLKNIMSVDVIMNDTFKNTLEYFARANRLTSASDVTKMFNIDLARQYIDSTHWKQIVVDMNVLQYFTAEKRSEFLEMLEKFDEREFTTKKVYNKFAQREIDEKMYGKFKLMEFTEDNVRATIGNLLESRGRFLAEKIESLFKRLSPNHKTNKSWGFGKKFILNNCVTSYGSTCYSKMQLIDDLRFLLNKISGRATDECIGLQSTSYFDYLLEKRGEWREFDGGLFTMRGYQKGTIHIQVSEDMAWKMNQILASLYPNQIAPKDRQPPNKEPKKYSKTLQDDVLSADVISILKSINRYFKKYQSFSVDLYSRSYDLQAQKKASDVLRLIGAIPQHNTKGISDSWKCDFDPMSIIKEIIMSGKVPNSKSYQYYPTPESVATLATKMLDYQAGESLLEPSAGMGDLLRFLCEHKDNVTCIEISDIRAQALRVKGWDCATTSFEDYQEYCLKHGKTFGKCIMNPPYESRWLSHLHMASKIVNDKIVAVLPSGANKQLLNNSELFKDWTMAFSEIQKNEFANTSVDVIIVTLTKKVD